jgi:hypothetical protein
MMLVWVNSGWLIASSGSRKQVLGSLLFETLGACRPYEVLECFFDVFSLSQTCSLFGESLFKVLLLVGSWAGTSQGREANPLAVLVLRTGRCPGVKESVIDIVFRGFKCVY